MDEARLWTDGRYFLQAAQQLSDQWKLMRMGEDPPVDVWMADVSIFGYMLLKCSHIYNCQGKCIALSSDGCVIHWFLWMSRNPPMLLGFTIMSIFSFHISSAVVTELCDLL